MGGAMRSLRLLVLFQLAVVAMTSRGASGDTRRSSVDGGSCHVTQTGTGCRYVLSLQAIDGNPTCRAGRRRHGNVTSSVKSWNGGEYVIVEKLDEAVVKVVDVAVVKLTRMIKQTSVRSLRHLRQLRADLRKVTMGSLPEFVNVGAWPSCYRFSTFNASWHEAREYCSAFGANLLALDSLKEAHIIDYLLNSRPEYETVESWWTSGNFMVRNQQWMWTSKHHLKPVSYSRWADPVVKQTDHHSGTTPARMHCLLLDRSLQYHWVQANCADRHHFVCEQDDA